MLEITYTEALEVFTIILRGEITGKTAHHFEEALEKASNSGKRQIVLQCNQLNTLSSKGIGLLMAFLPYFENRRISLTLLDLCPKMYKVLHLLGMENYLQLHVRDTPGYSPQENATGF